MKGMFKLLLSAAIIGGTAVLSHAPLQAETGHSEQKPGREASIRFTLPKPTGPYTIGTTELHLIDRGRPDPWVEGRARELMISIWYPARDISDRLAPYMKSEAARHYEQSTLSAIGVQPGRIDWSGIRTHAWTGAPVANPRGSYPVVLYSPGGGVPRTAGTLLVEELASSGYIVVTVDHTYDASEIEFPDGRVEVQAMPGKATKETVMKMFDVRELDIRFVLDQLAVLATGGNPDAAQRQLPEGLGDAMDLKQIGIFGHSAGGAVALQTMYDDRRIDAGILMDGTLGYLPDELLPVARHGLDRPFMLMGAGQYKDAGPDSHRTRPDWKSLWNRSAGWKLDLSVPEGNHFTFTDYQTILPQLKEKLNLPDKIIADSIGTVNPQQVTAAERAYVTAFFDKHLRYMSAPLLDGPVQAFPDIDFVK